MLLHRTAKSFEIIVFHANTLKINEQAHNLQYVSNRTFLAWEQIDFNHFRVQIALLMYQMPGSNFYTFDTFNKSVEKYLK